MINLTVGQVSSVIAAIINVLQLYVPLVLALLLVGHLKDDMSCMSFSSIGMTLHSSHWPELLRTDKPTGVSVERFIKIILRVGSITVLIITAASIVTPLGLSDAVVANNVPQSVPFPYVRDNGPFGYGTPNRSDLGFNRWCGYFNKVACPGTINEGDITIPQSKLELFQSGLKQQSKTVSSYFDIQWRSYSTAQDPDVNNGDTFTTGIFRQLGSLLLDGTIEAIEGLVVDTVNGGVAFRNHTLPEDIPLGATWSEDLLVMEPDTQCVNTNLTLDFTLSGTNGSAGGSISKLLLTDRGGFIQIDHTPPEIDDSKPDVNPNLYQRAYFGAWYFNALTALYFNVTDPKPNRFSYMNSELGKTFSMPPNTLLGIDEFKVASFSDLFTTFIQNDNSSFNFQNQSDSVIWPNPFSVSGDNYTDIHSVIAGISGFSPSDVHATSIASGLAYGAPKLSSGEATLVFSAGSQWTLPIYSCASAVKVSLKTFNFRFNGTNGLKSLHIESSVPKTSPVRWGVENNGPADIQDVSPLWGLVDTSTQSSSTLDVVQSPHLYLPGYVSDLDGLSNSGFEFMAGSDFHSAALASIYNGNMGSDTSSAMDYSGRSSFAMFAKWQQLASTSTGTAQIINLIFTDLAANGLVGSRSWLQQSPMSHSKRDDDVQSSTSTHPPSVRVPVRIYQRQIRYNWLYGIPAFVSVFITIVVSALTLIFILTGRSTLTKMRQYLYATSTGRVMATFVYPGEVNPQASTKVWARTTGAKKVRCCETTGWVPRAADQPQQQFNSPEEKWNTTNNFSRPGTAYTTHSHNGNLPGYEGDQDPLVYGKMGTSIQLTPVGGSPVTPSHGRFGQQQLQQQQQSGYGGGGAYGVYPSAGFGR